MISHICKIHFLDRPPNDLDFRSFEEGDFVVDSLNWRIYALINKTQSHGDWLPISREQNSLSSINYLPASIEENLNIYADETTGIKLNNNKETNSVNISLKKSSESEYGTTRIATASESIYGEAKDLSVSPFGLQKKLGNQTEFSIPVSKGTKEAFYWLPQLKNGEILIGSNFNVPYPAKIKHNENIEIEEGPNSLKINSFTENPLIKIKTDNLMMESNRRYLVNSDNNIYLEFPLNPCEGDIIKIYSIGKGHAQITFKANEKFIFNKPAIIGFKPKLSDFLQSELKHFYPKKFIRSSTIYAYLELIFLNDFWMNTNETRAWEAI